MSGYFVWVTALIDLAYQMSMFAIAATFKVDTVTDLAYGTCFALLAIITLCIDGQYNTRQVIGSVFVIVWGLRLSGFLFRRILAIGHDQRFNEIRGNFFKFAGFWFFQWLCVWVVFLPMCFLNSAENDPALNGADVVGIILWSIGFLSEAIGDQQKYNFKNDPRNKGRFCNIGLWHYTRHPNYFGEIAVWWGTFLICVPVLDGAEWLTIISPIFISFMLLFVSGMPTVEGKADARFASNPDYQDYKKRTSPIIPFPPSLYVGLPLWFKRVFCLEFPMYETPPEAQAIKSPPSQQQLPQAQQSDGTTSTPSSSAATNNQYQQQTEESGAQQPSSV